MTPNNLSPRRVDHSAAQKALDNAFCDNEWVTLYFCQSLSEEENYGVDDLLLLHTYLINSNSLSKCLSSPNPDIQDTDGAAVYGDNTYERFPYNGIEPLVTLFTFYGAKPYRKQLRLHEDIIYMFHLFEKSIDDFTKSYINYIDGEEIVVATIEPNRVRMLHSYLMTFIASKQKHLVCAVKSDFSLTHEYRDLMNITIDETFNKGIASDNLCIYRNSFCINGPWVQFWLNGKRVVPYKKFGEFVSTFEPQYEAFAIGYNKETCSNEDVKCNNEQFRYRRVFFKKQLLERYRINDNARVEPYSVSSLYFSIKCDTCNNDYIWTYLKDIRCLPYSEQQYWKAYNIQPIENGKSQYYIDAIENGCWNPKQTLPDYLFRDYIYSLNQTWNKKFGWALFLPLSNAQRNMIYRLFSLTEQNCEALSNFLMSFNLVLSESINNEALNDYPIEFVKDEKSISKLEKFLEFQGIENSEFITFLKNLNSLRSKVTNTHRSSTKFDKRALKSFVYFGVPSGQDSLEQMDLVKLSISIFRKANETISTLQLQIQSISTVQLTLKSDKTTNSDDGDVITN